MKKILVVLSILTLAGCFSPGSVTPPEPPPDEPAVVFDGEDGERLTIDTIRDGIGFDSLGVQHSKFPVRAFAKNLPADSAVGNLDWTFGTSLDPIKTVLDTGKVKAWRVHFFNGPGLRNRNLGRYEPHSGMSINSYTQAWEKMDPKLVEHQERRARLYCDLFEKYPEVTPMMSGTLEHNMTAKAVRNQQSVIKRACPRALIVDNPMGGVAFTDGDYEERHGTSPNPRSKKCIVSLDGSEATDVNFQRWWKQNSQCEIRFVWSRVYNGRFFEGWQDPRQRTAWPTRAQVKELFLYAEPYPELPTLKPHFCGSLAAIKRPKIWKPWAEHKPGSNDVRANKPVYITPYRGNNVVILDPEGGNIGNLRYYGTFEGGMYRYYSGTGSNLRVLKMLPRERYVYLKEGSRCFGPFHPLFRQGAYRQ